MWSVRFVAYYAGSINKIDKMPLDGLGWVSNDRKIMDWVL